MIKTSLTSGVFFLSIVLSASLKADEQDLRVGQYFPAIFLPSLGGGKLRSISSFRGKKLILHVFASW